MDKSLHVIVMYILTHLALIFFVYPGNIIDSTTQGHWAAIFIGVAVHFIFIYLYMKGLSFFPKKDLISIYFGAGKIVSIIFLLPLACYLLMINIITIRAYSEIITIVFLSNTPLWAIMALLLSISTFIAISGIETIFRTGILLMILFLPPVLFVFFASFQNVDWHYFLPLNSDLGFFAKREFYQSFFAFSGGFIFLGFVQPYFSYSRKKILLAAVALVPFFIFSVYIPILTFGQATASLFTLPYVVVVDTININWLMFDRVTMFFLLSLITFIFLFISLIQWKTVRIINKCIPAVNSVYVIVALSLFTYLVCLFIPNWKEVKNLFWWNSMLRFYILIAIPISVYMIGLHSKRGGKQNDG
ncbi:Spore germination protein [Evansella caseinilytica]|uniref:Spore germination protein n=1 Tax=Evansella caseinilytica TaxID=1503961 RepID=A0A1H3U725_9BACI|nr:GerAB/ArcD/ProY family transporter [Evansella caseinilytica]SDZ58148.1 Spore germination protein [Evansella caseinilytica]